MASARELLEQIRQQVFDFVDTAPRSDDITMLAVQRMV
jgi:serine phosphatase RsbU (regulator of sigma subunit)